MNKEAEKNRERRNSIRRLIDLHGRRCWYCGQKIDEFSTRTILRWDFTDGTRLNLEHIIPKSKGGDESLGNLALACANCNRAKSSQEMVDFLKWVAHIRSGRFNCLILGKLPREIVDKLENFEWDALRKDFFE